MVKKRTQEVSEKNWFCRDKEFSFKYVDFEAVMMQ